MALALPSRPFFRTSGSFEAFDPSIGSPHLPDEATHGTRVDVRGWITDIDYAAPAAAWIDIEGVLIPVELSHARIDVARAHAAHDVGTKHVGFTATVVIPDDVRPGLLTARIVGRSAGGGGIYAEHVRLIRIAHPRCAVPGPIAQAGDANARLRVRDTRADDYTLGRGAHTIREEASLHVSGRAASAGPLYLIATPPAGPPAAWTIDTDASGAFDAALWIGGMPRGPYRLTLCSTGGDGPVVIRTCAIEIAGPHYLPPQLTALRTPPDAGVLTFADAGSARPEDADTPFGEGRPIGVSGWCLDPASSTPPLAVFAEIDGLRGIPLSNRLPDPRPGAEAGAEPCGFGGILDTVRLGPGSHRVRLLAAAVSGAGWYVISDRQIDIQAPAI